jgi:hypothetical protein
MRGIVFLMFIFLMSELSAHTYYVQDRAYNANASDMNRGTDINQPWATWQKAFRTARAGDTVYFRGGSWYPTQDNYGSVTEHHASIGRGNYGSAENPICFFAYPPDVAQGNIPILDCRNTRPRVSNHVGLRIAGARYLIFRGLTIKNVRAFMVDGTEMWCAGILATDCEHLVLDRMTASYVGGSGFFLKGHDTLYVTNCDAHNNCDSLDVSMPGGDGDGFNIQALGEPSDTSRISYIWGCRAWNNSDDGFDISSKKQLDVHDCWSWNNGYFEGDATGFKLCLSHVQTASKRRVYNCIAAYNKRSGFVDLNLHYTIGPFMEFFNNTVYKCARGFASGKGTFDCNIHPASVIYRNNLVYDYSESNPAAFMACDYGYPTYVTQDHNTWVQTGDRWHTRNNPDYRVTDDDFISLDSAQLRWPRKADGSLPDINFLRPKQSSDLVDRGIDVGLAYTGSAPDIGALEYGTISVRIISPEEKQRYTVGDRVIIEARAVDVDHEISEVDFYFQDVERMLLGQGEEVEPSVWKYEWESDTIGYYGLLAKAKNTEDESAISSLVNILIYPYRNHDEDSICQIIPNPNNGLFVLQLEEPLDKTSLIHIVSLEGKLQAVESLYPNEIMKVFDLQQLETGSYGIVLESEDGYKPCNLVSIIKN